MMHVWGADPVDPLPACLPAPTLGSPVMDCMWPPLPQSLEDELPFSYMGFSGGCSPQKGFSGGLVSKESAGNAEDPVLIPGLERSPGVGNGYPLQYSCLENPRKMNLAVCSSWGHKESDTTERLTLSLPRKSVGFS